MECPATSSSLTSASYETGRGGQARKAGSRPCGRMILGCRFHVFIRGVERHDNWVGLFNQTAFSGVGTMEEFKLREKIERLEGRLKALSDETYSLEVKVTSRELHFQALKSKTERTEAARGRAGGSPPLPQVLEREDEKEKEAIIPRKRPRRQARNKLETSLQRQKRNQRKGRGVKKTRDT